MKKLSILISLFVALIWLPLKVNAQDIILLKSGQKINVKVLKENSESVRFIVTDDSTKTEKVLLMKFVESVEKNVSPPFISNDSTFNRQCESFIFTNVIYVDSTISKDQLFQKTKQWFSEAFVSSKNVIDNADKDEGVIFGHAIVSFNNSTFGYVSYNIEVRCKNGRVKYRISDFMHKDACVVNVYGYCPNSSSSYIYSIGTLSQKELPEYLTLNKTGRSKSGREKMWHTIKDESKSTAYNLIQSLKQALNKDTIKAKDSW